jgi:hypothetical protein
VYVPDTLKVMTFVRALGPLFKREDRGIRTLPRRSV